jgi:putative transposase
MPRKPRQFETGNIYHIINKGVDGRKIFLNNQDYSRFTLGLEFFNSNKQINLWDFVGRSAVGGLNPPTADSLTKRLETQRKNADKPIVELMAFTLMPNHYHLIIREIVLRGISLFMQKIGGYTTYFNQQYNRKGSLFESSYKYVEVKNETQLFVVFNYVHTNPIELIEPMWKNQQVKNFDKAKEFLINYKWSSCRDYVGISSFPNAINKQFFLEFFGNEKNCKKEIEDWIKFKADNYKQKGQFNSKDFE